MQNQTIDLLKTFISDKICQRKNENTTVYSSSDEQQAQFEQLRRLEVESHLQNAIFKYAKWYAGNNEIIVLEGILLKVKEIEQENKAKNESRQK